jgi:hypothetical protein
MQQLRCDAALGACGEIDMKPDGLLELHAHNSNH